MEFGWNAVGFWMEDGREVGSSSSLGIDGLID